MLVTLISFDGKSVFERIFSFRELCSDELVSSTLLNRNLKDSIVKSRTNDYFDMASNPPPPPPPNLHSIRETWKIEKKKMQKADLGHFRLIRWKLRVFYV